MKLFSFKTKTIDVIYKNGNKGSFEIKEPSILNSFFQRIQSNSYLFLFLFLPLNICKGFIYSIYLKIKNCL